MRCLSILLGLGLSCLAVVAASGCGSDDSSPQGPALGDAEGPASDAAGTDGPLGDSQPAAEADTTDAMAPDGESSEAASGDSEPAAADGAKLDAAAGGDGGASDGARDDASGEAGLDPFRCLGQPLPATAPSMISIGGTTESLSADGTFAPLGAVKVDAFVGAGATAAASATSGADGTYLVTLSTGGTPVDGYLRAQRTGYLDTYVYPPAALASDSSSVPVVLVSPATVALAAVLGVSQSPSDGMLLVAVVDCDGKPVAGATVQTDPAGTLRYLRSGVPSSSATNTDASGAALIFNVMPGSVMVGASAGGMQLRAHAVQSVADAVTAVLVEP